MNESSNINAGSKSSADENMLSVHNLNFSLPDIQTQFNIKLKDELPASLRTPCIKEDVDGGIYTGWGCEGATGINQHIKNQQEEKSMKKSPVEYLRATTFTSSGESGSHSVQTDWSRIQRRV